MSNRMAKFLGPKECPYCGKHKVTKAGFCQNKDCYRYERKVRDVVVSSHSQSGENE